MNREEKAAAVQAIVDQLESAQAVFAVDYRGISVPQAAELRGRLRDADATFRVVKNSLTERAADQAGAESLRALLEGPTALTFVRGDAAVAAKALADFARVQTALEFKGGIMGGEELTADQIRSIARLPARDVLYGQLVGTVAAPVTGLVRGLNGLLSGLAVALGQIAEQGLVSGGDAPADAPESDSEAEAEAEAAAEPAGASEPGEPQEQENQQTEEADASAAADPATPQEAAEDGEPAAEAKEEA
jgi:large subunit ribosomal protein L10